MADGFEINLQDLLFSWQFNSYSYLKVNVIVNLYSGIRARLKANNSFSESFPCKKGVEHAENLSPFIFNVH